jgi:hypothetical protein
MINEGVAPPDLTSAVGQVRLALGDTDPTDVAAGVGSYYWFSDEEITALIAMNGTNTDPRLTAVYILRIIAVTPALILKKWSSADLNVDGPAITSAILRAAAAIEAGVLTNAQLLLSEYVNVVPTGAAVAQPAYVPDPYPTYGGKDVDPTLPWVV